MGVDVSYGLTLVAMLRADILNYDLAISSASSRVRFWSASMEKARGRRNIKSKRLFVRAKVNKEIYEAHLEDLLNARAELVAAIDACLNSYPRAYRNVFRLAFLDGRALEDVSKETKLPLKAVERIVKVLARDLTTFYGV